MRLLKRKYLIGLGIAAVIVAALAGGLSFVALSTGQFISAGESKANIRAALSSQRSAERASLTGSDPGVLSPMSAEEPYSTGGSATVNDKPYDATFFKNYGVNPFLDTD